jgi:hypothetical protein
MAPGLIAEKSMDFNHNDTHIRDDRQVNEYGDSIDSSVFTRLHTYAMTHTVWLEEMKPLFSDQTQLSAAMDARVAAGGGVTLGSWLAEEATHGERLLHDLASGNRQNFAWHCVERELQVARRERQLAALDRNDTMRWERRIHSLKANLNCIAGREGGDDERLALIERLVDTHEVNEKLLLALQQLTDEIDTIQKSHQLVLCH